MVFVCLLVITVMYAIHGVPWAAALLWLPVLLWLAFFIALFCSKKINKAYKLQSCLVYDFQGPHHRVGMFEDDGVVPEII